MRHLHRRAPPSAARNILLELIGTKVNYVVQEAIVVIKDIFRRYPNQYEGVIGVLCENLVSLDEPEAKASMVWIIGEYAERIDNAGGAPGSVPGHVPRGSAGAARGSCSPPPSSCS